MDASCPFPNYINSYIMLTQTENIIQELRRHHIAVTANRVKVLSTAYQLKDNISTVTVQKAVDYSIERTSVHRALRLFCKKGVLAPVPNVNGIIEYKLIIRANNRKHHGKSTFVCSHCGKFYDIMLKEEILDIPKCFSVEKVIIEGLCEQCGL